MDFMSESEFIRLHGQELFDGFVEPLQTTEEFDGYIAAGVHRQIIKALNLFPQDKPGEIIAKSGLFERVSFIIFKNNYIKKYGQAEWDKGYEKMIEQLSKHFRKKD